MTLGVKYRGFFLFDNNKPNWLSRKTNSVKTKGRGQSLETENQPSRIEQLDDIAKSFQRESEALREILRNRDQQIAALKAHSLCLRTNFKTILEAVVDRVIDSDIQFHAKKMIGELEQADSVIEKVGSNANN